MGHCGLLLLVDLKLCFAWGMQLAPRELRAQFDDSEAQEPTSLRVGDRLPGDLSVLVTQADSTGFEWAVENTSDRAVRVRSLQLIFHVTDVSGHLRMLRHGYQSWSPTDVAILGEDRDPSSIAHFEFLQAVHHADQRSVEGDQLRSEWFTLLIDDGDDSAAVLIGFLEGSSHDGTIRLETDPSGQIVLIVEAFLGGAVLSPGERRVLHRVVINEETGLSPDEKLRRFAHAAGDTGHARVSADFQVGWCSWYQYFHDVTEDHIRANLRRASSWPFEVFQIDDGFQAGIGDWLVTNEKFPSGLNALAEEIAGAGFIPGLWLAPFLAAPDSRLLADHPDFTVLDEAGNPLRTWWNPPWGGGDEGFMYGLDTSNPAVLDHLESIAHDLVEMGFRYLKLDFTFSPSVQGSYFDPSLTPAQRVRAGFDAIRRGAGEECFILGCGVPLSNVVGVVDAVRIGQDVAPLWALEQSDEVVAGYLNTQPSTKLACLSTIMRSCLHRRVWLNDPDCVMLRTQDTALTNEAATTWAEVVAVSGGLVLVSDDLALLGTEARVLLDRVVEGGRAADRSAARGEGPFVDAIMNPERPGSFWSAAGSLDVEFSSGARLGSLSVGHHDDVS